MVVEVCTLNVSLHVNQSSEALSSAQIRLLLGVRVPSALWLRRQPIFEHDGQTQQQKKTVNPGLKRNAQDHLPCAVWPVAATGAADDSAVRSAAVVQV